AFDKGLTFKMGQTHVQALLPELLEHIEQGRLSPDIIISHRLPLAEAASGYELFDKHQDECRKGLLLPWPLRARGWRRRPRAPPPGPPAGAADRGLPSGAAPRGSSARAHTPG